ncbi:hypothetical protein I5G60_gp13 [Mycobacterium phage Saguaro]|uniref:DUF7196 domain-containing protein n=1 Tax=Mycobacterium phage Saguaro TaxID=2315616 RepID=A0A386K9C9_9CAUD|nr:hypothetical protein I5G60_gp13 [Mycobacterium phage Saguaro]AYD82008.1 hypothetical protein SEA_SAGUARO_13 [Mycobacterium phage Saguaro]
MGCNCGGRTAANNNDTLGYYVVLPDGTLMPSGVNPDDPDAGAPPYFGYYEARNQVVLNGGGTVRRLRRSRASA